MKTEKQYYIKVGELKKACKENSFLLLKLTSGQLMGLNTKVADIVLRKRSYNNENETSFIGFIPCGFQEYITYKRPFVR